MTTIRLVPSTYYLSNSTYLSVSNASNMYTNTDSTTYATVTNSRTSTSSCYIYVRGFNFDDIPSTAIVSNFTIKLKGYYSGGYAQLMYLYNDTTALNGSSNDTISDSVETYTFNTSESWDNIKNAGSDFGIRINCRRASRSTTSYIYIYGAEIEVEYTIPTPRTITTTLTGNGAITPNGSNTYYDGDEVEVVITPTNKSDPVTAMRDGSDITSQLVAHGLESTVIITPDDVTTNSIQSGSSYAQYAVNHSAESPYSSDSNMYASSGSTGYATYSFDFSDIPSNAAIENIEIRCYGHRESSTIDSTHVSQCVLYQGSTAISDEVDFPDTDDSIITIVPNTMPTRAQLDNISLRHYVGYYGGLVLGISFEITYSVGTGLDHYTYIFTVSGNSTIAITIGAVDNKKVYLKINGSWTEYSKIYKKINGSWVEQDDWSSIFDTSANYVKGN